MQITASEHSRHSWLPIYRSVAMRIAVLMMVLAISGCSERMPGSKAETDDIPAQKSTIYGQFTTKGPSPEEKFADAKRKAESGYAKAQLGVARMYYNGDGIAKDDAKAAEWYQKAAEQGDAFSQYKLGEMYDKGEGVARNAAKAAEWWQKAAAQGNAAAQDSLKLLAASGH